jgi:hypothetical protein
MTYFLDNSPVYAALRQSIYDRLVSRARAANAILRETKQKAQVSSTTSASEVTS